MAHLPVLLTEVVTHLNLKPGAIVADGTLGEAGHSLALLKIIGDTGRLIGLDQDPESIEQCRTVLKDFKQVSLVLENFVRLDQVLDRLNIPWVDAVILDVGFSSGQIEKASRGFSFEHDGPLDMRMNPEGPRSARDLVHDLSEHELARIFWEYGQERQSRRFARALVDWRQHKALETTQDLVQAIESALPRGLRFQKGKRPPWAKRHPATRVFQALRIEVNDELGVLKEALPRIWERIRVGGRLAVISFHSLEDRIVKCQFRDWASQKKALRITKRPVVAGEPERLANPRSRSAKLRVVEKIA